jgi:hypothetical protein
MSSKISLRKHFEALREADIRAASLVHEADIRYRVESQYQSEQLRSAEQRALTVKDLADAEALRLSRVSQTYKDEKANELREQISSERNLYVTKSELDAAVDRLGILIGQGQEYIAKQSGAAGAKVSSAGDRRANLALWISAVSAVLFTVAIVVSYLHGG